MGPDAIRSALFAATESLCNTLPPGSVTIRQIAEDAGVNRKSVGRYFDSKEALLAATMFRVEEQFLRLIKGIEDPAEAIGRFFDELNDRPTYPRLLNWMLLEGMDPIEQIEGFPFLERLLSIIGAATSPSEAQYRLQALLAFVAGWSTTHEFTCRAAGLDEDERRQCADWGREQAVLIALGDH
jgi:AcrR family transcriptional regulator